MKRSSFLKLGFLGTSLLSTPYTYTFGKAKNKRIDKGFKVDAGKDRFDKPISLFEGDRFYTKVATQDTDGDLYVYESTRQKKGGPALHFHYEQDEFWYVLKGEFMIKVGDEIYQAKEGDSVFGPRMVPHAFAKVGDGEAKLLMTFQPA
jgi:mannose-6-phosphate isomerase-like protein (cupin superfamily)